MRDSLTALSQVVLDSLPEGTLPADFDLNLEDGNIEEALSAVTEALGGLGESGGIDVSQLGDLASQLGGVLGNLGGSGGIDVSQLGDLASQLGNSDGSGFDFSQFGGFGQSGATAGYKGKCKRIEENLKKSTRW